MSDKPIRILLIEDNPGDARLIREMLNEAKSAPLLLQWSDQLSLGLQKLAEDGADVVLLDLGLPDSQGLETYAKVQSQFPAMPIVVLSGLHDESVAVNAVRAGAQDYLVKGQIDGKLLNRAVMYAIERKRSEKAVEKLRHQIELVLNSVGEGIFGLDLNGNHTFVNPSAAKMLGYEVDELMRVHSHSTIHHSKPDGSAYPEEECPIYAAIYDGIAQYRETEVFWRKDGSSFPVSYTSTPIREGNEITGAVVNFADITERKRTESLLRARMRLMDFAAAHSLAEVLQKTLDEIGEIVDSPIGFYHFVGDDQKTLSLQAWSTRTIKEFCTVSGKGLHYDVDDAGVWVDCIHERRPVIHNDYISLPHRKGMPEGHAQVIRELVVPIMRSDRIVAILGVGNKPSNYTEKDVELVTYMADVAWEIVKHKRAEEAIVRSKEEWERTFASVPDLIAILDDQHRIVQVNDAMARRLGKLPEECIGLTCFKVVHGMDEPLSFCPHSATLKDGKQHSAEVTEDRLGGNFVVTVTPLYSEQGRLVGSVHVAHDITERKVAEDELRKAHDELEIRVEERTAELVKVNEALDAEIAERKIFEDRQEGLIRELESINHELDDFAHMISHDLKAPLRAMKSLSNWVLQDHADTIGEDGKEKMLLLNSRIDHLNDLIDGILEYSRIGRIGMEVAEVDLGKLVDKVIHSLLCPANIRITMDTQLPVVTCDVVRIGQVFQNLVDNAVKYVDKQQGEIRIGCVGDEKQWTCSVADNGPGIDRKHYDRIFQLFQSINGTGEKKGMGVGLAIAKKIVEMHGGRIWVDSEVGQGSTFFFTLPRVAASEAAKQ
ncbi:MAG: PAS domain S-box protein [Dissulfurispiraceae bacterium]|jgi:PAS domain S-box-containing protein